MSDIKKLIEKLCPDGVEYKRIDSLFETFSGMTGVSDKWKESGNCQFIDYLNVYNNMRVDVNNLPYATVKNPQQNILQKGDILLTCASETPDECAMSSVIRDDIKDGVFLDDHLFAIRLKKEYNDAVDTAFLNYYMHSSSFRVQVCKKVRGVTRFYITGKPFMSLEIPVPPLEVQSKIVEVLDNFTELEAKLEAELEAELEARRKQYEYYRNQLLTFDKVGGARFDVKWMKLGEVCNYVDYRGKTPKKVDFGIFLVTAKNIRKGYIDYEKSKEYISEEDYDIVMRRGKPMIGDVLITTEAPCGNVAQIDDDTIALAQRVIKYRPKDSSLNSCFLKYVLLGNEFQTKLLKEATGATAKGIKGSKLHNLSIPIPPLEEQQRIVSILDRFEALTTDLQSGLPAEIEARRKQYEYYREKLLTFKRKSA